jgi:hypothetical protein
VLKAVFVRRVLCVVLVGVLVPVTTASLAETPAALGVTLTLVSPSSTTALPSENVHVELAATDASGAAVPAGVVVHAVLMAGAATFASAVTPGLTSADATTDAQGHVDFVVRADTVPQALTLQATAGDRVSTIAVNLTAPANTKAPAAVVVGFATAGLGPVPGTIEAPDNAPDGTLTRRGAVSIFGTGAIARDTHATIAYSTSNTLDQTAAGGAFVDNPADRPFPTYGDSSTRFDTTPSLGHLYARIDHGASSAMYGEFSAQGGTPEAGGGYSVLVNGTQVKAQSGHVSIGGFTSRNDVAYGRLVLSPTGLGIADQSLHPDIVVGSDVVTLVSLDTHSGALVSMRVLSRGTDYAIDTATGALRFINILLPYDAAGNPQNVIVQYEYTGSGALTALTGATAGLQLGAQRGHADAWYLNDASGAGNLAIAGEALRGGSPAVTWSVSHEHTIGQAATATVGAVYGNDGDGYRARFATHGPLSVDLGFDSTSAAYQNPFGTYTSPGISALHATVTQRLSSIASLDASYLTTKNNLPATAIAPAIDSADARAALTLRVRPSRRVKYHAGVVSAATSGTTSTDALAGQTAAAPLVTTSDPFALPPLPGLASYSSGVGLGLLADAGAAWEFAPGMTLDADRLTQLSSAIDPYDPPSTQLGLTLATGPDGNFFVRQSWQQTSINALAATQQNATYAGTARSTTSAGFEQRIGDTTLETGYAVDNTSNGTDLYQAIGVRRTFHFSPDLSGDGFVQSGNALTPQPLAGASANQAFFVTGGSLAYRTNGFFAAAQAQIRTGYNSGSSLLFGASGPISSSLSVFSSMAASYTPGAASSRTQAGISYRPADNDRYLTLFSIDSQTGTLYTTDGYITNVAQLQELYRPSSRTELAASLAYKISGDATFAPRTTIFGIRADQRIGPRFDIATELHQSATAPIDGASATGLAVEAGVRLGGQLRLAAGYNFSGYTDPAAAVSPTHRGIYATITSYVNRIFGWGRKP